jgi:TonB-dependent starch-binding outer membrane protein SusC
MSRFPSRGSGRTQRALRSGTGLVLGLILALPALPASAQELGRITGIVTTRTNAPLGAVQVYLVGTSQGTLTSDNGRFVIPNVAPGTYNLRAERLGYAGEVQSITVRAGEALTANFALNQQALALDEIVVTGTAGAARRREIGNSISQIDVANVSSPSVNVDRLLQSQAPGLLVTQGNGSVGGGAQIRLRGAVSVSQSNQPLIYIDGVRVRSEPYARNQQATSSTGRGPNVTASPLNDINPADIERIEVIKGSAASTLYGTEAAAGVIQIFTKQGNAGAARWTMQIDQGFNRLLPFAPDVDVRPDADITADAPRGSYSYKYLNMDPYIRDGHRQRYSLGVSGGGSQVRYFLSGQWDSNEGVLPLDQENKAGIRGNFTFNPISRLAVQLNSSYNRTDITGTPAGNNAQGLTLNAFRRERNYFSNGDPDTVRLVLQQDLKTRIDRFIVGSTVNYDITPDFTNRVTIGYDQAIQDNRNLRKYGYRQEPNGILYSGAYSYEVLTADYVGSYRRRLFNELRTTLSLGGQSVTTNERAVRAEATNFPGPGDPDIDSGANRLAFETRLRQVTAGFFGQALFDFMDRYFITVGMRVDGNSAFGESFGLQSYPKVSASYVISDEAFWNSSFGALKLRAAYGQSGRAPGAFDAVRTWNAIGYGGQPAYTPRNRGNANLGPERTGETEYGFDWSVLNDRVSTAFTYYHQKTTDALFSVRKPPSEGFTASQLENVGTIENRGVELSVITNILDRRAWGLTLNSNLYTNKSKVLDLGGAVPFAAGGGWVEVGHPVMAIRGVTFRNGDAQQDPVACSANLDPSRACYQLDEILGPQQPTHVIGLSPTLRMPRGVELSARAEYQGGHWIADGPSNEGFDRGIRWPTCADYYALATEGRANEATAERRYYCKGGIYRRGTVRWQADFAKLRDVTLRLPLGALIPQTSNSVLTVSAQNWYRWRNSGFPIFDPEMVSNSGFGDQNPSITEHIPPPATLIASLRINF